MTIGIILGSTRKNRAGEAIAQWVASEAAGRAADYKLVDLAEFNLSLLEAAVPPVMANKQYEDEATTAWSKEIDGLDGFVFVTPEYNHSVPAAMKNAVDVLAPEWMGKPVAFVGYGADGAIRAVEHWRTIVANFNMKDTRAQVAIRIFEEMGENGLQLNERRAGELAATLDQLEAELAK